MQYRNILVPVAFDADDRAEDALSLARTLAAPDARVTVLHVMEEPPAYAINYVPEEYARDLRVGLQQELDAMAGGFADGTGVLIDGHAGRSILDYAAEAGVDCIVMRSHKPGLQDYFLGSTASRVVRHATCAVHVLR